MLSQAQHRRDYKPVPGLRPHRLTEGTRYDRRPCAEVRAVSLIDESYRRKQRGAVPKEAIMPDHSDSTGEADRQGAIHQQDDQMAGLAAMIDRLRTLNRLSDGLVHAIRHMMD